MGKRELELTNEGISTMLILTLFKLSILIPAVTIQLLVFFNKM